MHPIRADHPTPIIIYYYSTIPTKLLFFPFLHFVIFYLCSVILSFIYYNSRLLLRLCNLEILIYGFFSFISFRFSSISFPLLSFSFIRLLLIQRRETHFLIFMYPTLLFLYTNKQNKFHIFSKMLSQFAGIRNEDCNLVSN